MSFPRYPQYKASGVEWLGDVPEGWKVVPCRNIVKEKTAKNDDAKCQDYLSLMANVGVLPYAEKGDVGNKKPEDLSKCKIVSRGDFVINSMNYGIGSYGLSAYDGVCSPVYIVLKPKNDIVESRFAFRIFECRSFQKFAQSFGNGILEHRSAINWDILKSIGVGIPTLEDQKRILEFLDRETGKIDELVAEQRRLMELLKEKRQAVISHAVTKGLNPHAPMKPSGIEWLGDVPVGWEVKRSDSFLTYSRDQLDPKDFHGLEVFHYSIPVVQETGTGQIEDGAEIASGKQIVKKKVVLVSKLNPRKGTICIAEPQQALTLCSTEFVALEPNGCDIRYLSYLVRTEGFRQGLESKVTSVTNSHQRANPVDIYRFWNAWPVLAEQTALAEFLDAELLKFDTLTAEAQRAIELLQERRTALISAAVTGQIDVRPHPKN